MAYGKGKKGGKRMSGINSPHADYGTHGGASGGKKHNVPDKSSSVSYNTHGSDSSHISRVKRKKAGK